MFPSHGPLGFPGLRLPQALGFSGVLYQFFRTFGFLTYAPVHPRTEPTDPTTQPPTHLPTLPPSEIAKVVFAKARVAVAKFAEAQFAEANVGKAKFANAKFAKANLLKLIC